MKRLFLPLLTVGVIAAGITSMQAQQVFITGRAETIRSSNDGGVTFSIFTTVAGGQLRGIDAAQIGGNTFVFANNINGDAAARPLFAYNSNGTQIASTTYNASGAFNEQPLGYFGGYVYGSSGGTPQNFSTTFNGSAFGTAGDSGVGNWQGNNIAFASSGGTDYIYTTGTSGPGFRRNSLDGDGTVSGQAGVTTSGGPADLRDIAFSDSGRLLTIGATGIFLSGFTQQTSDAITLESAFAFTATENPLTGDMGANARDFALFEDTVYAVTDTNIYRYAFDDAAGTLTFVGANLHGFSSNGVQITIVPEPSTYLLALGGLAALFYFRRRIAA